MYSQTSFIYGDIKLKKEKKKRKKISSIKAESEHKEAVGKYARSCEMMNVSLNCAVIYSHVNQLQRQ